MRARTDVRRSRPLGAVKVVAVLGIKALLLQGILPDGTAQNLAALWDSLRLTFVFEATGLIAFGLSWMIKGRFLPVFEDAAARAQPRAA